MRNDNVIMILLKSLSSSYEYLITALETVPKELTMEHVTACFMHKMSKRKEKEPQGDDVVMVLHKDKGGNPYWHKDIKNVVMLWQTRPYYMFLLQLNKLGQKQRQ